MKADRETVALLGAIWVHDLVNLLAVAETSALLAERADGDREKIAKHTLRIRATLASAKELASRCLAIGRGEPIERRAVELAPLAVSAWDQAQGDGARHPTLVVDVAPEVSVLVERSLFLSVLTNVMRNAIDASAASVRISVDGGAVQVKDDGVGFDEGRAPRGNGIGLDGCRAIMRLHGGALTIEKLERGTAILLSGEDLIRRATA